MTTDASLVNGAGCAAADRCVMDPACELHAGCRNVVAGELRWHYGDDPKTGAYMFCSDCGAEVYAFEEGYICSGCGKQEDAPWCPCGHDSDDICLNGAIYGPCGDEYCGGSCDPDVGTCQSLPGCCAERTA